MTFQTLFERGGFPEPFLLEDPNERARWRFQYTNGLIREDILDFERVHDLKKIKYLVDMLKDRVGSTISYESLARDLELHAATVKKYISILEALFIIFIIKPYSKSIARSILKEPKIYFYDTALIEENGPRFENMVALHLLQACQFENDYLGVDKELFFIKTKDHKEVDFALSVSNKLCQLIECKYQDSTLSKSLNYFSEKYSVPGIQLLMELDNETQKGQCEIRKAKEFLKTIITLPKPHFPV